MPSQLTLHDVSKAYAGRPVLDQVSLTVRPGEVVGVVGDNGAGKSTLLRLMAGREAPDSGTVTVTAEGGVGLLGQTLGLPPEATVGDAVDLALADLRALERRIHRAEALLAGADRAALDAYGELVARFEARGGYRADARVRTALAELGLAAVGFERTVGSLAGGEQARLALACVLAAEPELLLLDEPTNHLDAPALEWLEARVRGYRGTVVAVCHDRLFLERVTDTVLEVDGDRRSVRRYGDGYQGFLAEKAAARRRWEEAYRTWLEEIARQEQRGVTTAQRVAYDRRNHSNKLQLFSHGVRVQRQVGSRVRNSLERLRRLHENPVPRPPDPLRFTGRIGTLPENGGGDGPGAPLVRLSQVEVGDRLAVESLELARGARLLVHGPNGAGKSTLLKVVAGRLAPDTGEVRTGGRIGYLPQEVPDGDQGRSLLAAFAAGRAGTAQEHRERLLSLGLFRAVDLGRRVGELSVGQRRRLALARLLCEPAEVLVLDEPTNHLAPDLVEELEQALAEYRGTLLVVSHDRRLRERFTGEQRELTAGRLAAPAPAAV
ncbi:ribosomal protection-like ABC-F family protein [Kitasatospora sp. MBT63]|uniref:ribosomal protection-like ABC-F family protein n=1 Tax=Kitasatospora sp. MBT63 TaxID=1444768 RepID=UPI00053BAFC7|nr:ABC-F family ATP-binding cassette domain-containing protein [Kitasatospora sp. MBT63]